MLAETPACGKNELAREAKVSAASRDTNLAALAGENKWLKCRLSF
jgi:hypothetical protein